MATFRKLLPYQPGREASISIRCCAEEKRAIQHRARCVHKTSVSAYVLAACRWEVLTEPLTKRGLPVR